MILSNQVQSIMSLFKKHGLKEWIAHYLPELSRSAYKRVTVENLLDRRELTLTEIILTFSDIYRFMLRPLLLEVLIYA